MTLNMEQGARSGAPLNSIRRQNSLRIDTTPRIENFPAYVNTEENGVLMCPVAFCGQDYSHLLDSVTPYVDGRNQAPSGWSFQAWCENGHDYTIVIRFHKGQIEIFAVPDGYIR